MASWRRRLAEALGTAGTKGPWGRRYAEGLGATTGPGAWMRRAASVLGPVGDVGSWDRRLGGTGTVGSWDRREADGGSPPPPPPPPPPPGPPAWLPSAPISGDSATSFIDFRNPTHAYTDGAISSLAAMVGGANFVSGDVTANGCEVLDANANRPEAIGGLLADLCAADNTVVVDFWPLGTGASTQPNVLFVCDDPVTQAAAYVVSMQFGGASGARSGPTLYVVTGFFADWNNGNFNGTTNGLPAAQNVAVGSFQTDGIHNLFNIPSGGVDGDGGGLIAGLTRAFLGYGPSGVDFSGVLNGYIRSITVYPLQADAALVAIGQTAPTIPLAIGMNITSATVYPGNTVGGAWGGIGGQQPYVYDVVTGSLPHGVTLGPQQSAVFTSGIADTTQTVSASVRVTDGASTAAVADPAEFTIERVWLAFESGGDQTWIVPDNWNSADNLIWALGSGGGSNQTAIGVSSGGGGGSAYAEKHNYAATPGASVALHIGDGTGTALGSSGAPSANDSWLEAAASVLYAQGGARAVGATAGAAGTAAASVGTNKRNGGVGGAGGAARGAGGGGGAGGPNGVGGAGGSSPALATGGAGGGGADGGAAGAPGVGSTGGDGGASIGPGGAGGSANNEGASSAPDSAAGGGGGGGTLTADTSVRGGSGNGYDLVNDEIAYSDYGPSGGGGGGGAGVTQFLGSGGSSQISGGGAGGAGLVASGGLATQDGNFGLIGMSYAAIPA